MRITMFTSVLSSLAAVSVSAAAQNAPLYHGTGQESRAETGKAPEPGSVMTPEQKAAYNGWTVEQRADFDLWPRDVKAYFWSLSEERQAIFWKLNTNDRMALVAMDEEQRAAAWAAVEQQMRDITQTPEAEPDDM